MVLVSGYSGIGKSRQQFRCSTALRRTSVSRFRPASSGAVSKRGAKTDLAGVRELGPAHGHADPTTNATTFCRRAAKFHSHQHWHAITRARGSLHTAASDRDGSTADATRFANFGRSRTKAPKKVIDRPVCATPVCATPTKRLVLGRLSHLVFLPASRRRAPQSCPTRQ